MTRRQNGGRLNLQEAVVLLLHSQAAFVSKMAEMNRRRDEIAVQSERRFASIEREMHRMNEQINEMMRVLRELPEAIRQKIGFKTR